MKTRIHEWLDIRTRKVKYGIQVFYNGKWCHTHVDGKPVIYSTAESANKRRAELRKRDSK